MAHATYLHIKKVTPSLENRALQEAFLRSVANIGKLRLFGSSVYSFRYREDTVNHFDKSAEIVVYLRSREGIFRICTISSQPVTTTTYATFDEKKFFLSNSRTVYWVEVKERTVKTRNVSREIGSNQKLHEQQAVGSSRDVSVKPVVSENINVHYGSDLLNDKTSFQGDKDAGKPFIK